MAMTRIRRIGTKTIQAALASAKTEAANVRKDESKRGPVGAVPVGEPQQPRHRCVDDGYQPGGPLPIEHVADAGVVNSGVEEDSQHHVGRGHEREQADEYPRRDAIHP